MLVPAHVLAAIRQPAFVYRREGIVEAANDRVADWAGGPLAGMTPADVIACLQVRHRDGTLVPPNDLPAARALRGEEVVDVPLTVTTAGGRTVHVLATASPIRDGDTVAGALSVWQDVTALVRAEADLAARADERGRLNDELRVQQEELRVQGEELRCQTDELRERGAALRESETLLAAERQRFFGMLETLPVMVCLLTPDHHVPFANRAFREKFGEAEGRRCYEYCCGFDEPCSFCESFVPLATGKPHHWEFTSPDGSTVIDAYDFPFADLDGAPLILEMDIDITERRRDEAAVREEERRHAFFLALGDRIRDLDDPAAIAAAAAELIGRHLGANGVVFCEIDEAGACATVRADWNDGTVPGIAGRFRMDDFGIGDLYRRGEVRRTGDVTVEHDEDEAGQHCALKIRASLGVPVLRGGRVVAVLAVHSARPRTWTDDEARVVREAGDRLWSAVERARAVAALAESEAEARSFMENMIDAVAICETVVDAAGEPADIRVVAVNPAFLHGLPMAESEVVGRMASEILPSMDPSWFGRFLDVARSGSPVAFEEPFPALGGWYRVAAFRVRGGRVAVVFDDITGQREAEAVLRERDLWLNLALDAAAVGVFDWDPVTGEETWDDRIRQQWGLSPDAPVTHEVWESGIHPEDRAAVAAANEKALDPAGDGRYAARYRVIGLGDGVERRVASQGRVLFEDGRPVRMIGTTIDVTEQERAEEGVRARERLLQSLYRAAPAGIGLVTGLHRGRRFVQVNDYLLEMTGYARDELIGRETRILYTDEGAHASVTDESAFQLEAGGRGEVETRWRRKDGTVIDILLSSSLIDPSAPVSGVIFTALDITDLRETERALMRYARDLRRSNEELQRFAYVASHDLQEPLRSIVSFSQLLERRYKGKLDRDADEFIGFIVDGGNRMQRLINDLLQVSRVETMAKPPVPTDAGSVVRDAVALFNGQIAAAGGSVTVGPMPTVMADPAQLEQVFANLVGNAVKYRREGVPLEVAISASRTDGMVEFAVRDNGIGIEAEYFDRIFEMFRRLHTHDRYEGTGIGLAVVKRIVERHGGTVRVESTPGEGSTFYFTLPAG